MGIITPENFVIENFVGRVNLDTSALSGDADTADTTEDINELGDLNGGPFSSYLEGLGGPEASDTPIGMYMDLNQGWNMIGYTLPYGLNCPSMLLGLLRPDLLQTENDVTAIFPNGLENITNPDSSVFKIGVSNVNKTTNFTHSNPSVAGRSVDDIVGDHVTIFKDNNADVYWPEFGFNGIGDMVPGQGYHLRVDSPSSTPSDHFRNLQWFMLGGTNINVTGLPEPIIDFNSYIAATEGVTLNLNEGWNMIAYTKSTPILITDLLDEIDLINPGFSAKIQIIKNNIADVYWPEYGFNGIGDFIPCQAYQIHMFESVANFQFPPDPSIEVISTSLTSSPPSLLDQPTEPDFI